MGSTVIVRFFALVLAGVLAWAGFAAQEPGRAPAALMAGQALAALHDGSPWHLDPGPADEPAQHDPHDTQSHAETLSDLPALVPVRHAAQAPALTMARPGPYTLATLHPPYLDGLRRPPRPAQGAA